MLNLTELIKEMTISSINTITMKINGEDYKICLEKVTQKQIYLLSFILSFIPNGKNSGKDIEAYNNYYIGSKKYKKFIFLLACLYIFKQSITKEKEKEAKQLMFSFFNVDDINAFTSTVKEFKDFYHCEKDISVQVQKIFSTYYAFNDLILLQIITFAYYHPFDFEIEIDVAEDFNFLNIKEAPADAPF